MDFSASSRTQSSDSPLLFQLKGQAQELQKQAKARGEPPLKHAAALEMVARRHGFKDWNAAAAAAATPGPVNRPVAHFPFQSIDAPLPRRPLRLLRGRDPIQERIHELYRWAEQLEFIATKVDVAYRRDALGLVGGEQPYVFVLDSKRWTDGLLHLCDRGYEPFKGIALSLEEIEAAGVVAWNDEFGSHGGGDMYSVVNDDVMSTRDEALLKRAARLVAAIGLAVDRKLYGAVPTPSNQA